MLKHLKSPIMYWKVSILGLAIAWIFAKHIALRQLFVRAQDYKSSYEIKHLPRPFHFGYEVLDEHGNKQQRQEHGDEHGTVKGSYGYTDAHGIYRHVNYVADHSGFRAVVKSNEPGLSDEDPASVHLTIKSPPPHVLENSYASVGSYDDSKLYLTAKTPKSSQESHVPVYREIYQPLSSQHWPVIFYPLRHQLHHRHFRPMRFFH